MEITPLNVFPPHLPRAGLEGWRWHAKTVRQHAWGMLLRSGTQHLWEESALVASKGHEMDSARSGAFGCGSVTIPGVGTECRWLHLQWGLGWLTEGCLKNLYSVVFPYVVLPSTSASCAVGEVGGVSGGSSLSLDCRGVAVAPIWSSRQNVPVLSPKYLSPELPSSSRARVPWQRRAWLNSPLGCIRLAKPSEK